MALAVGGIFVGALTFVALVVGLGGHSQKNELLDGMRPHVHEFAQIVVKQDDLNTADWAAKTEEEKIREIRDEMKRSQENPEQSDPIEPTTLLRGHFVQVSKDPSPRIVGKVVTLSRTVHTSSEPETIQLHDAFARLDSSRSARSPAEVNTIVLLEFDRDEVGKYGGVYSATREACSIKCVDRKTGAVIARANIVAPDVPQASQRSQTSAVSESVIIEWLNSLPQKSP